MKESLIKQYQLQFGEAGSLEPRVFFAPGRVNLIGEYTDFNGGHVFPCALTKGTYAAAAFNDDQVIRLYSENFKSEGVREFALTQHTYNEGNGWTNYVLGVMDQFEKSGLVMKRGLNIFVTGNIPNGAGLSSSASLELVIATLLNVFFDWQQPMVEMVKLAQRAENQFIGVQCGIMDQFAIGMGKKDHAILLDTNKLTYEYAPIALADYSVVIANTNKRRDLAESKYNERRAECERALSDLQEVLDIQSLGELTESLFDTYASRIQDPIVQKRGKHAVYENRRTLKAYSVLNENDLKAFGELMNASHVSLRDDFQVSCKELDVLVELAWNQSGVLGSRMTGAGFGGCTVSLVAKDAVERFIENVGKSYSEQTDYKADFYIASIGDGAREI